jgi:type IV pilus assembly protein PilQ
MVPRLAPRPIQPRHPRHSHAPVSAVLLIASAFASLCIPVGVAHGQEESGNNTESKTAKELAESLLDGASGVDLDEFFAAVEAEDRAEFNTPIPAQDDPAVVAEWQAYMDMISNMSSMRGWAQGELPPGTPTDGPGATVPVNGLVIGPDGRVIQQDSVINNQPGSQSSGQPTGTQANPQSNPPQPRPFRGEVNVDEFDLVDLHVNNEDLGQVLRLLSMQSRRNVISSREVNANITADLYGVTFYEALDAILHVNGFGYREQGNFIYVYTLAELEQIAQATRLQATRVIELNYLNAVDAARFAAPLLSETGVITTPNESADFLIPDNAPVGKDTYANTARMVIHDYEENIDEIAELVASLDTRPTQVLVEATILQAQINEENAFGVDFSLIGDLDFTEFLNPLAAANSLIGGRGNSLVAGVDQPTAFPGADGESRAVTSSVGNVGGKASLKAGIIDEDVAVFLRVLDEVTDVTVISNPKVLTLNRQAARVLVGTRVGFLNTTTTQTATTQTVEFLDTGTQLHIRPFVSSDNLIRLEVKPQVSSASLRESVTQTGQAVTIPDEDTTELVTNLLVRDGQTVVLGGLFTESTSYTRRQVPFLGDIPIVGAAFKGQDDAIVRNEIIFMLTPSVIDDAVLTLEGERAQDFVEHARVGSREGLLPWSRERQVGRLLIEADELAKSGDEAKALLKIQRALALSPHSTDAIAMRERIAGRDRSHPSRSILDDIFRRDDAGNLSDGGTDRASEPVPAEDFASVPTT